MKQPLIYLLFFIVGMILVLRGLTPEPILKSDMDGEMVRETGTYLCKWRYHYGYDPTHYHQVFRNRTCDDRPFPRNNHRFFRSAMGFFLYEPVIMWNLWEIGKLERG